MRRRAAGRGPAGPGPLSRVGGGVGATRRVMKLERDATTGCDMPAVRGTARGSAAPSSRPSTRHKRALLAGPGWAGPSRRPAAWPDRDTGQWPLNAGPGTSAPALTWPAAADTKATPTKKTNTKCRSQGLRRGRVLPPLLEVKDLHTEFRTGAGIVRAVDGISYTVEPGETVAIVGESGSGKSVSALSVLRLIPDPPGRITGGEIRRSPAAISCNCRSTRCAKSAAARSAWCSRSR